MQRISQIRDEKQWNYHFAKYNCSALVTEIANVIGVDVSEKDPLNRFDNLITRIKMYAVSSILATELKNPDVIAKIGTVHELANLADNLDNLLIKFQQLISGLSIEHVLKATPIANALQEHPDLKNLLLLALTLLQKQIRDNNVGKISAIYTGDCPITVTEIKALCRSILTGSTSELTYKIYNLLDQVFSNYYDFEIHSSGFVYERVREERRKQRFTPYTIM